MKSVVHLITALTPGGAESMLARLVSAVDRSRLQQTVVSLTDRGVWADEIERSGTEVVTLGIRRGMPDPRAILRFRSLLRSRRPDLVQSWLYHADIVAALAGRTAGIPVLWNIRCSRTNMGDYSRLSDVVRRLAARLSAWPAGVVVNSTAGREYHERIGYHPRAWHLIPNGFDLERFRPDPAARLAFRRSIEVDEDTPLVGMLARYDPMKDHQTFLAAMADVAQRSNVHVVLAGDHVEHSNEALQRMSSSPSLRGRVHLLGLRSDVPAIMAALDVLVLASAYGEGFPNVLGEAMASGAVCVTTDTGDAAAIVGAQGFVVPVRDSAALAHAIFRAITLRPDVRLALKEGARQRIEKSYSLHAIASRYEELYMRT